MGFATSNLTSGVAVAGTDQVDHPAHYNSHPSGVECIDIIEHWPYNIGAAMKYLWRAGLKPGADHVEDLRKCIWYVEREIKRIDTNADDE